MKYHHKYQDLGYTRYIQIHTDYLSTRKRLSSVAEEGALVKVVPFWASPCTCRYRSKSGTWISKFIDNLVSQDVSSTMLGSGNPKSCVFRWPLLKDDKRIRRNSNLPAPTERSNIALQQSARRETVRVACQVGGGGDDHLGFC